MNIQYLYYESIDSTNLEIRRLMESGCSEGTVAHAGLQTAGRGRSGHTWDSPRGDSVSTSIALYPKGLSDFVLPRLTIIAAVSVAKAVEDLFDLPCAIKWPNDILVNKKKICGILTERMTEHYPKADGGVPVIVGIGVNVHQRTFPEEIAHMATSVDLELQAAGRSAESHREEVTKAIWKSFAALYEVFCKNAGSLESVLEYYNDRLISREQQVRVLDPAGEYEGKCLGMDEAGRLIVESETGLKKIDSGEVSVRGIYGYV